MSPPAVGNGVLILLWDLEKNEHCPMSSHYACTATRGLLIAAHALPLVYRAVVDARTPALRSRLLPLTTFNPVKHHSTIFATCNVLFLIVSTSCSSCERFDIFGNVYSHCIPLGTMCGMKYLSCDCHVHLYIVFKGVQHPRIAALVIMY